MATTMLIITFCLIDLRAMVEAVQCEVSLMWEFDDGQTYGKILCKQDFYAGT